MVSRNRNERALYTYDQRNKLKKHIINPNINFMKRPNLLLDLMGASLLVFALTSCSESEKKNPVPAEIQKSLLMTALNSNPELSKFTEAFQTLDLSSSQATGLTILALKNDAIGEEGLSSELLKRHILEASYTPSQLSEQSTVTSFGGLELVVKTTEGLVALNNTPIGLQLTVGNSMLYSLDKPIPSYNTYLGLGTDFTVGKSRVLRLRPEMIDLDDATFEWTQEFEGQTTTISNNPNYDFITLTPGTYTLTLKATKPSGEKREFVKTATVTVTEPENELSPYPNRVFDWTPAPGLNLDFGKATTKDEALSYALSGLDKGRTNLYATGAFGGYIVMGFDHTIMNKPGYCDFTTQSQVKQYLGWSDPSPCVIWVAYDENGNGKPDEDEWYEIKGSEYGGENDLGMQTYTYNTVAEEKKGYAWTRQGDGATGYVVNYTDNYGGMTLNIKIPFWVADKDTYTLSGRELKGVLRPDLGDNNPYNKLQPFAWGYACNNPNGYPQSAIDIDWAVDKDGKSVRLPGIDFIKIVNAIQGNAGAMGEYRLQLEAVEDLHLQVSLDPITTEQAQAPIVE